MDYFTYIGSNMINKNFREWFKNSKVVDSKGKPLVMYHGTTHYFKRFDPERGNIENDFGRGIYLSNNPRDAAANYAGEGPDLTNRIERRAEELLNQAAKEYKWGTPAYKRAYANAVKLAKKELAGNSVNIMPVYVSLQNPFILGGPDETILETTFDEETEEQGGSAMDFVEAFHRAARGYYDVQPSDTLADIYDYLDYGKASVIIDKMRTSESLAHATDENGDLASHEIIRKTIELAGYDGIIDKTVDRKFGSGRRIGKQMAEVDADTFHVIAFRSEQVKSATGNRGTFDPADPIITNPGARKMVKHKGWGPIVIPSGPFSVWRQTEAGRTYVWTGKEWSRDPMKIKMYPSHAAAKKAFVNLADRGIRAGESCIMLNTEETQKYLRQEFGLAGGVRKNSGGSATPAIDEFHARVDARKAEGKRRAESPQRRQWIEKNLHRMQAEVFNRNMIKALEIHPWMNTVEDWQRYFEAKYIQQLRRKKPAKRKNPASKYYISPVKESRSGSMVHVETCRSDDPRCSGWALYKIGTDGLSEWVSDHKTKSSAEKALTACKAKKENPGPGGFRKIDVYIDGEYAYSTNWTRTLTGAVRTVPWGKKIAGGKVLPMSGKVKAVFAEPKTTKPRKRAAVFYPYSVKLKSDKGTVTIKTMAQNKATAVKTVLHSEGAPECAVVSVVRGKGNGVGWSSIKD